MHKYILYIHTVIDKYVTRLFKWSQGSVLPSDSTVYFQLTAVEW